MANSRIPDRSSFRLTLVFAVGLHGVLGVLAVLLPSPRTPGAPPRQLEVELSVEELFDAPDRKPDPSTAAIPPSDSSRPATGGPVARSLGELDEGPTVDGTPPLDPLEPAAPGGEPALTDERVTEVDPTERPRRRLRLRLSATDLAELTREDELRRPPRGRAAEAPAKRPTSPGLLVEGLQELDGERGTARSSASISAAYRARAAAPAAGRATFVLTTDAQGNVTGVQGADAAGQSSAWANFLDDLRRQLSGRRLRVPSGAAGLRTTLRVESGVTATTPAERDRTKRGAALGQDHHARDFGWDESTHAAERPDRLTPTVGFNISLSKEGPPVRVTLLGETIL